MDLWGVGCVFFEVLTLCPLFPGSDELDQINKIHSILGTPPESLLNNFQRSLIFLILLDLSIYRHATHMTFDFQPQKGTGLESQLQGFIISRECMDLMKCLLTYDPKTRITADDALKHPYFKDFTDLTINFSEMQLSSV